MHAGICCCNGDEEAIRKMKEHPLSSEACRKRAEEHFDKDKCFEKYIELYESLIKASVSD